MSVSTEFYLRQVAVCAKAASETPLANQRDIYLRAEAAWQALADREVRTKTAREQREAEKAEISVSAESVNEF